MLTIDTIYVDRPFRERLAAAGLDAVSRVLAREGDHLAAWSRTSDAVRVDLPAPGGAVFIKRYHYPRWRHRRRALFRGVFFGASRARNEFRNLAQMRSLGIQAVRPVAWGERRSLHFLTSCFLITEAVPDAASLAAFVQTFGARGHVADNPHTRHELLRSLARDIRRMHDAGFVHQDLFWRNVLIRPQSSGRFEFYFLDASVGRRVRWKWRRRDKIVRDLAALSVLAPDFISRTDQYRFMLAYLAARRVADEDRAWLLDVQKHWAEYRESETVRFQRGRVFDAAMLPPQPISAAVS